MFQSLFLQIYEVLLKHAKENVLLLRVRQKMTSASFKAEGSHAGPPQHSRSDFVRSQAFRVAFGTFEAGLMFSSSTAATSRP